MMTNIFFGVCMLTGFFLAGIGLWAIGQQLRKKGYGTQLDKIGRQVALFQGRVNPVAMSTASHIFAGAQHLNRLPLLGTKNQVVLIERVRMAIVQMEKDITDKNR